MQLCWNKWSSKILNLIDQLILINLNELLFDY